MEKEQLKRVQKFLYHLSLSTFTGIVIAISTLFFTQIYDSITSFNDQIQSAQLENQVRNLALEKVFIDKISELKWQINTINEELTTFTEFFYNQPTNPDKTSNTNIPITELNYIQQVLQEEIASEVSKNK